MFEPMELTNDAVIKVIPASAAAAVMLLNTWCVSALKVLNSSR